MRFEENGEPDYHGARDEIVRLSIEHRYTQKIRLRKCCDTEPRALFQSDKDYFVMCPKCGRHTKMRRHLYEAKQEWNKLIKSDN